MTMPLSKPEGTSFHLLTYETKVRMVEANCIGCSCFVIAGLDDGLIPVYGCDYGPDVKDFNPYIREPYLTVPEIAQNTCQFWRGRILESVSIDSSEGNWSEIPPELLWPEQANATC